MAFGRQKIYIVYSIPSASQVHYAREFLEGLDAMVDWEEGKKGRKTSKTL